MNHLTNEEKAIAIGNNPAQLKSRLYEALSCLHNHYREPIKNTRFDFENKRLYLNNGHYIQWKLRPYPTLPEDYLNQQTSIGCCELAKDETK